MAHSPYHPYPQTWQPPSLNSDVLLESQLDQIRSLGRIEAKVENLQDRQGTLETKLDDHIQDCRKPRRKFVSVDGLKETWPLWVLAAQLTCGGLLLLSGHPDKASSVWAQSPAFREQGKSQD